MELSKDIVIVGGLGRCGTTLMMRLLDKAGFPVYAPNKVSYEDDRAKQISKNDKWLGEAQGKAIKILDIQRMVLPCEFNYKVIWLKRDYREQAKSQIKMLQQMAGLPVSSKEWKKFYHRIQKEEKKAFEKIIHNEYPYVVVTFEELITNCYPALKAISDFLWYAFDYDAAEKVVIPRGKECQPNFHVESLFL